MSKKKPSNFTDRTGERRQNNSGEWMEIVKYNNNLNMIVKFDDDGSMKKCNYKNFEIGNVKHPLRYEDSFAGYIDMKLGLNLDDIWNWDMNNKLGINPYEIYKSTHKKVWLFCLKNNYHNYDRCGNKIGYLTTCNDFYNKYRCPYCSSKKAHHKDSLAHNYPNIAKMISISENNLTFEDCYNISCHSAKKFYFKCHDCDKVSLNKVSLYQVINQGYSCSHCRDEITIPNKWIRNLLNMLNIDFISECKFYYLGYRKSVDVFIPSKNLIIEMDGNYGNHTFEYDYWRDFLNIKYGGYKTIRVNLKNNYTHNEFNCLKEETIKSLSNILDLNNLDWNELWSRCQNNYCVCSWNLWNSGIHDTSKIAKEIGVSRSSVIKYLNTGLQLKKCSYSPKLSMIERSNKRKMLYWVIQPNGEKYKNRPLSLNEIYNSNSNGLLDISKATFDRYIKPYGDINIDRIIGEHYKIINIKEKLKPYNGWKFIEIIK